MDIFEEITRDTFAKEVGNLCQRRWPLAKVTFNATTSDCPVIRIAFPDGQSFNVTITRARR